MHITACVIAKNEEKNILKWLHIKKIVDEIIVVDTGSSDNTKSLAEKMVQKYMILHGKMILRLLKILLSPRRMVTGLFFLMLMNILLMNHYH